MNFVNLSTELEGVDAMLMERRPVLELRKSSSGFEALCMRWISFGAVPTAATAPERGCSS